MSRIGLAALALVAGLAAGPAEAQVPGDRVTAEGGGVALGGDNTGTINVGLSNDDLIRLVSGLTSPDPSAQAEALVLLRARVPENARIRAEAVATLLRVLGESGVPEAQLVPRFEEIARRHVEMLDRLRALDPQDPKTARLVEEARDAIEGGRFEDAENLLVWAEDIELAAARHAQAVDAQQAANARLLTAAATRAERGELARQRVDYLTAADHFAEAAEIAPETEAVWGYQMRRADALHQNGSEFGDNASLTEAIRSLREVVLPLAPRSERPLHWAATQISLGAALSVLGEREPGTARLEEAVAAFRAAPEERTRERAPLDWAMTISSEGVALAILAERTEDAAMAARAVEQITVARNLFGERGDEQAAARFEQQLEFAQSLSAKRLTEVE